MKYNLQEALFDLPEAIQDRTVNVLVFGDPALPFNIVITRDFYADGGITALIKQQLKVVASAGKHYKEITPPTPLILSVSSGATTAAPNAIEAFISYTRQGHDIHQKLTLIELPDKQVLVFTGTFAAPWTEDHHRKWKHILHSLRLRAV